MHILGSNPRPRTAQPSIFEALTSLSRADAAWLNRIVQQMDEFQRWLQSSTEGQALSSEDARTKVEALESVENGLDTLQSTLAGSSTPRTCAQLLRQVDKEQALVGAMSCDKLCSPQVRMLLHNLASSSARTASHLTQTLCPASPAVLARLDEGVDETVQRIRRVRRR